MTEPGPAASERVQGPSSLTGPWVRCVRIYFRVGVLVCLPRGSCCVRSRRVHYVCVSRGAGVSHRCTCAFSGCGLCRARGDGVMSRGAGCRVRCAPVRHCTQYCSRFFTLNRTPN